MMGEMSQVLIWIEQHRETGYQFMTFTLSEWWWWWWGRCRAHLLMLQVPLHSVAVYKRSRESHWPQKIFEKLKSIDIVRNLRNQFAANDRPFVVCIDLLCVLCVWGWVAGRDGAGGWGVGGQMRGWCEGGRGIIPTTSDISTAVALFPPWQWRCLQTRVTWMSSMNVLCLYTRHVSCGHTDRFS